MVSFVFVLAFLATASSQDFYLEDGVPIIFGGNDRSMARTSSIIISPSAQETRSDDFGRQSFRVSPIRQDFSISSSTPVAHTRSSVLPVPQLCDPFTKPLVDDVYNGKAYHYSWCHDGHSLYNWYEANQYCSNLGHGFQSISIEDFLEDNFISTVILTHDKSDIWTSGNFFNYYVWSWLSGALVNYQNWSPTGSLGQPQPDNAAFPENCLSVLNNRYHDGIKWHDEHCGMLKPVICETVQFYGN